MRRLTSLLVTCAVAVGVFGAAAAQTKPAPSELKVQVVLTEFEGDKKVASLPYSFTIVGGEEGGQSQAFLRLGISVPIVTLTKDGESQTQYQDVGTNIDCRAWRLDDGRYKLTLSIERSSVYSPDGSAKAVIPTNTQNPLQPVLRRYRGSFDLLLRDGQTAEGPTATDPQSGRILKTEVSLKVTR